MGWSRYGDMNYVEHVLQYYNNGNGSVVVVGDGTQSFDVKEVHDSMEQFLGRPYVWGERTPDGRGFYCSGLLVSIFFIIRRD